MNRTLTRKIAAAAGVVGIGVSAAAFGVGSGGAASAASTPPPATTFHLVRSANAEAIGCLGYARAVVTITKTGPVERMRVVAAGLPRNTDFDLFVIQVPNAPFGLSWYQGDLETNGRGRADQTYVGRFSEETFSVAPNTAPAPVEHLAPFKDADVNPATPPVHQFHLGLWFNRPEDAAAAGCQSAVTPFNGEHNAGVQAMSSRNFPQLAGPLSQVHS